MIYLKISCYLDFSGISSKALASLVAQMVKNPPVVWKTWILSPIWEDPLEKEIATHSRILAWRIPQTEEPGRLQSKGSPKSQTRLSNFHFTSEALLFPSLYKWIYFWWSSLIELSLIHTFQRLPPTSLYFYLNIWWISGKVVSYRKLSPFRISQSNYLKGELSIF